jgi:tetratricopeptide (TPR) repeat protein
MNQQYRSIDYWNRILKIDPKNKVILTRTGDAYRNLGDYKTAAEYYDRAMNIDFDIYAAMGLALICKGEGNYEEAARRFAGLIRDDEKNYRLYIDLADCYMKMNRKADAVSTLESFQRFGIKNQNVNDLLAKIKGE